MKSNMLRTGAGLVVASTMLALAVQATAVRAEEPNPSPGLDGVVVRLCTESHDFDSVYCSSPNELIAAQPAETRTFIFNTEGVTMTLPGSFRFTADQLEQGGGWPRAVVYGPIQGTIGGRTSAYFWGVMFRDNLIYNWYEYNPTEISVGALGIPGTGLDMSYTSEHNKDFGFWPRALFQMQPYYVTIYLDQSIGGNANPPNPGIGSPSTLDGQVWGATNGPPY